MIFDAICRACCLGHLTEGPRQLSGGFLHQMFGLHTDAGHYAVKLLNPLIMRRPDAMDNYRRAEALECRLEAAGLPILPAMTFGGQKMQCLEGQFYYVFPWCSGKALSQEEITPEHAARIGALLARIHQVDRRPGEGQQEPLAIDWDGSIAPLADPDLRALMLRHRDLLYASQTAANQSLRLLPGETAICHSDMDSKNVLWENGQPRAIDLECLCYASPMMELMEMALHWSGCDACVLDPARLRTFVSAYALAGGQLPRDWAALDCISLGRLNWLDYNLRRVLGEVSSPEEAALACQEVRSTLRRIAWYAEKREEILQCLNNIQKESRS